MAVCYLAALELSMLAIRFYTKDMSNDDRSTMQEVCWTAGNLEDSALCKTRSQDLRCARARQFKIRTLKKEAYT